MICLREADTSKGNIHFAIVCDHTSAVKVCFAISYTLPPITVTVYHLELHVAITHYQEYEFFTSWICIFCAW